MLTSKRFLRYLVRYSIYGAARCSYPSWNIRRGPGLGWILLMLIKQQRRTVWRIRVTVVSPSNNGDRPWRCLVAPQTSPCQCQSESASIALHPSYPDPRCCPAPAPPRLCLPRRPWARQLGLRPCAGGGPRRAGAGGGGGRGWRGEWGRGGCGGAQWVVDALAARVRVTGVKRDGSGLGLTAAWAGLRGDQASPPSIAVITARTDSSDLESKRRQASTAVPSPTA